MRTRALSVALAAAILAAGCATVPSGPSVMALPGPQKSPPQFQDDQAACALAGGGANDRGH